MAIYWQGLAEALALGSQHGLDLATMLDLIADSPAAIGALRAKIPAILGDVGEVAFDVTGVRKDLLAMIESGQRVGVPMPAASAALISFMAATAAGRGGDDLAALIPHYLAAVRATTTPRE
jgi:3-hydroxyisobutyrate dehydrogenase-like beta-hydroxyacid dehydrogenase